MTKKRRNGILIAPLELLCNILPAAFWGLLIFGFEERNTAVATLLCAMIHECGHIIYILKKERRGLKIKGMLSGFRISTVVPASYDMEIGRCASGPIANIASYFICLFFSSVNQDFFDILAAINLATAISNLLPIKGYDGYGILRALIAKHEIGDCWIRALDYISSAIILVLCIFSLYLIDRYGGGYWIFAIFFVSMIKEMRERLGEYF